MTMPFPPMAQSTPRISLTAPSAADLRTPFARWSPGCGVRGNQIMLQDVQFTFPISTWLSNPRVGLSPTKWSIEDDPVRLVGEGAQHNKIFPVPHPFQSRRFAYRWAVQVASAGADGIQQHRCMGRVCTYRGVSPPRPILAPPCPHIAPASKVVSKMSS
jgi:hypothetical protein